MVALLGVSVLTQFAYPDFRPCQVLLGTPVPSGCSQGPALLPHPQSSTQHLIMQAALEDFLSPGPVGQPCPSTPQKTKPECASPSTLQMPASIHYSGRPRPLHPSLSVDLPMRTQSIILLLPCVIRDCLGFCHRPAPGTWHKVGTFN